MPEIVTDFKPFENSKKPLKTIAHCDFAPRFLPTKIREEPQYYATRLSQPLPDKFADLLRDLANKEAES
jgi:hypothetical protein